MTRSNKMDNEKKFQKLGLRQRRLLSESAQLEDEVVPVYTRRVTYAIIFIIILFVIWAGITQLPEVAEAEGEIVPTGNISLVQHPYGGRVSDILVEERSFVNAGDVLARLDADQTFSDYQQLKSRLVSFKLQLERYTAFIQEREADFSDFISSYPEMVTAQQNALANQRSNKISSLDIINRQIDQKREQLAELRNSLKASKEHRRLAEDAFQMRQEMAEQRLVTRTTLLESERAAITARNEVNRLIRQVVSTQQQLEELRNRLEETRSQITREPLSEVQRLISEIAETEEEFHKVEDVMSDLEIKAPASGLIFDLSLKNIGQVIQGGSTLMKVVPVDAQLEAKIKIMPRDVGHISVGDRVNVKVSSYDYARFGSVIGDLSRVSAFNRIDEQGQAYFSGWVQLESNSIGRNAQTYPLLPGMTVTAEVITGSKSLLEYLVDPVRRALMQGFRER